MSEFLVLTDCRSGAASPAGSVTSRSTNHSGSSNSGSNSGSNRSQLVSDVTSGGLKSSSISTYSNSEISTSTSLKSNQAPIGTAIEEYKPRSSRRKENPTIYLQVIPREKTKLNSSTCVDSDSSDESIQSDSEPEEQTQTQKPTPNPKMGCIQSLVKNRGQPVNKGNILISDFSATIDDRPTEIREESSIVLRYKTPYFRANATVLLPPLTNDDSWTIGWIQACSHMEFVNKYGDLGHSSWEVPALIENKIAYVSDSDGVSYPWYGSGTEIATVKGPTDHYTEVKVKMNDNFHPSVTWDVPISERDAPHLTKITRDQSFITWLAAVNERTNRVIVLRAVRWRFQLNIDVNPNNELGKRAKLVGKIKQEKPRIQNGANYIPKCAMVKPSANNSQVLVWRPKNGKSVCVVPAKESFKESNPITIFKGGNTMARKPHMIRQLTEEEVAKIKQNL